MSGMKYKQPCRFSDRPIPPAKHSNKRRRRVSIATPGVYSDWLLAQGLALPEGAGYAGIYTSQGGTST